jgi:hypothetical protein
MSAAIVTKIFTTLSGMPLIAHIVALRYSTSRVESSTEDNGTATLTMNSWSRSCMPAPDEIHEELKPSTRDLIHASPVRVPKGESKHAPLPDLRKIMNES